MGVGNHIEEYREIIGNGLIGRLKEKASKLEDKHIVNVNSTSSGGGVAELLLSIVPLMNDLGLDVGWRIHKGSEDFFKVTKLFHNALQGAEINLTDIKKDIYKKWAEFNSKIDHFEKHDLVVIHDPQPLVRIDTRTVNNQKWIWRCHIDMSDPNPVAFDYLKQYMNKYDRIVTTKHIEGLEPKQTKISPSIDPLSTINKPIDQNTITKYLHKAGIERDKPIIAQIGRFDKWKDPLGVIDVWKKVNQEIDCKLVLLGNIASDDPEGPEMFEKVKKKAEKYEDVQAIAENNEILVNAVQREADVVFQKSIKEGFALTVSEALWKETPVIGTTAGGIPLQIDDGENGYLIESNREAVEKTTKLLKNDELRNEMGKKGKEKVRENFLITRQIENWLDLYIDVLDLD